MNSANAKSVTVKAKWNTLLLSEYLINLTDGASSSTSSMIGTTGMHYEQVTDNEDLVYAGKNVNNYISFNSETWRILGVHNNICSNTSCSTKETRVKIIRNISLGSMAWSSSAVSSFGSSTIKSYLNGTYYNGLSNAAKNYIQNARFCSEYKGGGGYCQTSRDNNGVITIIGLMSKDEDWNQASSYCKDIDGSNYYWDNSNYNCSDTHWLTNGTAEWFIEPANSGYAWGYEPGKTYDSIDNNNMNQTSKFPVRPVVYLKASTKYSGGTGTSSNPYIIAI